MLNPAWFVESVEIEDLPADRKIKKKNKEDKEDKKIERNFYEKHYKVLVRFFSPCRDSYEAKIIVAVLW